MKKQFIVQEKDKKKRRAFYNYIHKHYKLKDVFNDANNMINNNVFPFVVDFSDNTLWVCNSITCCACAAQTHQIISIQEFKEKIKERKK